MKYSDGQEVKVGDKVLISNGSHGTVVCSIDTDEYSGAYPKEAWGYLKNGVLIKAENAGLMHYTEPDEDLELVNRREREENN